MKRITTGRIAAAMRAIFCLHCVALLTAAPLHAQEKFITAASTTSTEQSGLFAHLLPAFEKKTGIKVRVVASGTGQALDQARRGDADVVLVHDTAAEEKFIAEGFGVARKDVMFNDFVVIGPKTDPARARGGDVAIALQKIAASTSAFVSRGDHSGTHAAEWRYWNSAGIGNGGAGIGSSSSSTGTGKTTKGAWYRECGCGMGAALNLAASMNAYVLSDRGTWLSFKNRQDLGIVVEGDTRLFNQYGVMLVNPVRHPHVKKESGQAFIDWLVSAEGQRAIAAYKIGGEQLFFPNAKP